MSFFNDTYCQLCERLITKERWDKHLYSSRHLDRKVNGYSPAYFPQRNLTGDENITLEKAFWKMFFATRDIKEVEEFWWTYFMMTTNMKDYFLEENEERIRKDFREIMEGQFEHDLYNKSFSNQLESEDGTDTLERRIKWWMTVVVRGGPIPDNVYDYTFDELFMLYRKAIDPEMRDLAKALRDRGVIP